MQNQFNQMPQQRGYQQPPRYPQQQGYPQQARARQMPVERSVKYEVGGTEISLDFDTVRQYLVSGGGAVTDQELAMFLQLCKAQGLNPWTKDAYIIKYGSKNPAQIITSVGALQKRAENFREFRGIKSGVIVYSRNNDVQYRNGCFYLPDESVVGGWAEVYRSDRSEPTHVEVAFHEFVGMKKDGNGMATGPNTMWASKPGTMIRKVAVATALREAFPNRNGGLYAPEEMGMAEESEPVMAYRPEPEQRPQQPEPIPAEYQEAPSVNRPQPEVRRPEPEPVQPEPEGDANPFL